MAADQPPRCLVTAGGKLPESMAVKIVLQPLLSGLNYMHARGVTHRCAGAPCRLQPCH